MAENKPVESVLERLNREGAEASVALSHPPDCDCRETHFEEVERQLTELRAAREPWAAIAPWYARWPDDFTLISGSLGTVTIGNLRRLAEAGKGA